MRSSLEQNHWRPSAASTWGKLELGECGVAAGGTRREGGVERGDPWEGGDESENDRQANAEWR